MSDIYEDYRVFREQLEFDPDVDYGSAACERVPEYILVKKHRKSLWDPKGQRSCDDCGRTGCEYTLWVKNCGWWMSR